MAEKTYINGIFIKEFRFSDGGSKMRLSINVNKFIEELQANKNAGGYINIDLCQRREPDKNGNTHYAVLNEWKKRESTPENDVPEYQGTPEGNNDLPF